MTDHLDSETLAAYLENDTEIDRAAVEEHLAGCAACRDVRDDLQSRIELLRDPTVWAFADEVGASDDGALAELAEGIERVASAAVDAEQFYGALLDRPEAEWVGIIAANPRQVTPQLVERFMHATMPELDRDPEHVLALLDIAESVARKLLGAECRLALGHVSKQRSNALRQLARYTDAVEAAMLAEEFYVSVPNADFDVGQAQYTIAVALFKMTRYSDALAALTRARVTLEDFGTSAPLAKTMMLDAVIRIEQGEVVPARETLERLLPMEERLGQPLEAARVRANLAECSLRLGELDRAVFEAEGAVSAYRSLGNTAEEWRSRWTLAMVRLARNDPRGLPQLHAVAAAFEHLSMVGDAGFVKLDIVEELLRQGSWTAAARIARDLATLFAGAGVTIASVHALTYLREAVDKHDASLETVRYIREYVTADDPSRVFDPPERAAN